MIINIKHHEILFSFQLDHITIIFVIFFLFGCKTIPVKREIKKVQEITNISPSHEYIKAHMKDGKVYILYNWRFDKDNNSLNGYGSLLNINRNVIEYRGSLKSKTITKDKLFIVDLSEISLLETNDPGPSLAGGLTVVTGITAGFTIFCLINPKACFGSCPTFYANNGDTLSLQAEGFSASISPSLEKSDIDMLYAARPTKDFELVVTNEALETHSIRYANLLAFEKLSSERIFATPDGSFYRCTDISQPTQCQSQHSDCLNKVTEVDGDEYFSLADSADLCSKEELIITFTLDKNKKVGLVIGKRQTLLTTFLMYQGLAYMGNSVTYWLAELERGKIARKESIFDLLGGIEVFSKDPNGNWRLEGELNETGPIATDFNIIPLSDNHHGKVELKLRLNKGLWRIDYLGLATLSERVLPTVIQPFSVEIIKGTESDPLSKLTHYNEYLVTYPGDAYRIKYSLPFNNAELFLDSRGYYLEWIRDEWVKEQNFQKLNLMISRPSQYLKKVAREYKKIEPFMEETFWNSRYVKK